MVGKKIIFAAIGMFAMVIALIGVWLPGVPTTFPLIIALWAFGKSYPRLYGWINKVPVLRVALKEARRFEAERTVSRSVKIIAQSSAWMSVVLVWIITRHVMITVAAALLASACSIFMYKVKTHQQDSREEV